MKCFLSAFYETGKKKKKVKKIYRFNNLGNLRLITQIQALIQVSNIKFNPTFDVHRF